MDRLRSSGHILGLTFRHKLVLTVSNWVLNCGSRHKLMPGQYAEGDWCQSRRHIYRAVAPGVRCMGTTALRRGR